MNAEIKTKQLRYFVVGLSILLAVGLIFLATLKKNRPVESPSTKPDKTIRFASPLQAVDTTALWKKEMQRALKQNEKKTNDALMAMRAENAALKIAIRQATQPAPIQAKPVVSSPAPVIPPLKMRVENAPLTENISVQPPQKTPDTYVPSGTHVQAVLLGGADAAAGALNHSNPRPLLLRLTSRGRLPNHRFSHLKGCVATAAVVGDISAERGGVRLERLSCVKPNNAIIDVAVQGTVYGMDGKNGIRGRVVRREGALMTRASVAGFFSGVGNGFRAQFTPSPVLSGETGVLPKTAHILGQGLGGGANTAFEKIADYNIKRAEQYHPVVQISAGQSVDIVFTRGFFIRSPEQKPKEKF